MKISHQIALYTIILFSGIFSSTIFAQESTPAATQDAEITQNIKERLIETINEVSAAPDSSNTLGYVGKVKDIVQNTIILEDKVGKKNIVISSDTDLIRTPGNSDIKLENVKIEDGIIAIGNPMDNSDELQGTRIIVSDSLFTPPAKSSGIGTISKITSSSLTLTPLGGADSVILDLTSKTIFKSALSSLEVSDLAVDDSIIYTALVDSKDPEDLTATVIMRTNTESVSAISPSSEPLKSPKSSPKPSSSPIN